MLRRRLRPPRAAVDCFLRRRLERWRIDVFPRVRAARLRSLLLRLEPLAPPRVRAAVLRTALNGWCTARRFQGTGMCFLGCGGEDSVEHYAVCPEVVEFSKKINVPYHGMDAFLLLLPTKHMSDRALARLALRTATVYAAHCRARHSPAGPFSAAALPQVCYDLTMGHAKAARALAEAFAA